MAKILVVDDAVQIRELLQSALTTQGHNVVTVPSPDQALAVLAEQPIDLVVLDLSFPQGSGSSFLQDIRRARNQVPLVVYSGFVTPEKEKELRAAGANEVLSKDVGVLPLVNQIGKIIRATPRIFQDPSERKGKSLLVVDDEAPNRALLREFFTMKRYRVIEAESGEQAIQRVREEPPSVVLLDVVMSGMDGLTTLKKLLEIRPNLGVVMATGLHDDQTVKTAVALGAYGYVLKPFDLLYLDLVVLSKLIIAETAE